MQKKHTSYATKLLQRDHTDQKLPLLETYSKGLILYLLTITLYTTKHFFQRFVNWIHANSPLIPKSFISNNLVLKKIE